MMQCEGSFVNDDSRSIRSGLGLVGENFTTGL